MDTVGYRKLVSLGTGLVCLQWKINAGRRRLLRMSKQGAALSSSELVEANKAVSGLCAQFMEEEYRFRQCWTDLRRSGEEGTADGGWEP